MGILADRFFVSGECSHPDGTLGEPPTHPTSTSPRSR
jgi:hypothetical protein